jgi:RNA polymerase sigma-54 factor
MLSLSQKLSQQQKLSPQQIQYQKLLQLNTLSLEQRIKTELEINPILEEVAEEEMELSQEIEKPEKESSDEDTKDDFEDSDSEEFDIEDYMNDFDSDYEPEKLNKHKDEETYQPIAPARESLSEHLINQLRLIDLSEEMYLLGEEIIGNLDEDGYLNRDLKDILSELEMFEHIHISEEDAEKLLRQIQVVDPVGIACRTLPECLLVQLKNQPHDPYYAYLAEQLLLKHFDDFTKKRYDSIKQKMELTDETLKTTIELIQGLNPKPGEGNIQAEENNQITPDFLIEKVDDNLIITLNDRTLPSITISRQYLEMFNSNKKTRKTSEREKNTYKFLREKFESAKWFIACIQQRRETLMKIMQAIVLKQYEFFEKGPKHLHPMIYKDIAEEINMDISTISRVVNGKYVQSPMGIHELKYFFSEGLATDTGEEVSNKHIKERLKELIEEEDKNSPYSDDKLAEMLNIEGIHIARRTVAKYREQLRLPIARLRRQL